MPSLRYLSRHCAALAVLTVAWRYASILDAGEIWDGGGANSNWTTGANWNALGPFMFQVPPPNNGTANIHMAGNDNTSPNVDVPYSINSLTFDAGSVSFFLGGQELTIGAGGVTNNDNSTQLVLAPVKLAAAQTWTAAGSQLLGNAINLNGKDLTMGGAFNTTLNGAISDLSSTGLGGLILPFEYTGITTLSGSSSNTYGGITRVRSGTLVLSKTGGNVAIPGELEVIKEAFTAGVTTVRLTADEQISHTSDSHVKFWSHTLLDLNGHTETIARLFLSGENVNVTTGSGKLIVGEFIHGSGGVGNEPTITGNVDLNGGQPIIGTPDDLGGLVINGPISNGGAIFGNSVYLRGAANTYTGPTVVTGSVNLNKPVDGAFRGDVTITGYVELEANEQILAAPGNEVLIDGGNVQLNTFSETIQDLKIQGLSEIRGTGTLTVLGTVTAFGGSVSVPLNLAGTRVFDVQGTLSATKTVSNGSLVKTGPGVLRLHYVPNTYSGGTFINAGTVIASEVGLGNPAGAINFNGGLLGADGLNFTTTARNMTWGPNGGGFDISHPTGVFTISAQNLSGPGPLTKAGAGKLVLASPQSYTGGTTVSAGTLEGNTQSLQGHIVNNATLVFNQATSGAYAGNLSGAGTLSKLGVGALQLSGNNTNTGATVVSAGGLKLDGGNAIGDLSAVQLANTAGVLLELVGASETIGSLSGGGAAGGNVELGGGTLTAGANNTSTTFDGVIGGAGSVVKTGAGAWTLTGNNTYSGGTTFAGGIVSAASDANLGGPAGPLRFNGGALRPTGAFGATSRTIELQAGGGGLDIANTANLFTYAGDIFGVGSLTKVGTGKLLLSGSNSYAGGTIVTAGTLEGDTESLQGNILNHASVVFNQAGDGTYAGSLSGAGQLLKLGPGSATLTGANTGSGPITINEGGVRVATGGQVAGSNIIYVGDSGAGRLSIVGGGQVSSGAAVMGNQNGAAGEVIIDGAASKWTIGNDVQVGNTGAAVVDVTNAGTLQATNINVGPLGMVGGDGWLVGSLHNGGLVSPGTSLGALHLDGNYTQSPAGELLIELASASSYDQLLVTQDATLAGTLRVNLVGGFLPIAGQTFMLLTSDDVDFTFNTEVLPSVPGVMFDVVYNPQSVVLAVSAAFTADFDNDGDVDGADLTQWQGDFGVNGLSDADNDGDSDGADFLQWQQQLGSPAIIAATAAVPEPATLLLFASAALATFFRLRDAVS